MRNNRLLLPMLAIFIAIICLSTVSAVDVDQINSTASAVDDNSQLENVVIDEINTVNADDSSSIDGSDTVGIEKEIKDGSIETANASDSDCVPVSAVEPISDNVHNDDVRTADIPTVVNAASDISDYKTKTAYVYFDSNSGIENTIVKITPFILDSKYADDANAITGGTLKVYGDYHGTNLIATVDLDNCTFFELKFPECPESLRSDLFSLWYEYEKYDEENGIYYHSRGDNPFYTMAKNNLNISVEVEGNDLIISLDNIDYWDTTYSSIKIYEEGMDEIIGYLNYWYKECRIPLDKFADGKYAFYAVYDGYVYDHCMTGGNHYPPATSNKAYIYIHEKEYDNHDAYVFIDCNYGVENSIVKITPFIVDSKYASEANAITGGILKIYSDYHKTNLITAVDLDNNASFEFKVPECPGSASSKLLTLFYTYEKCDDENGICYTDNGTFNFHVMNTNNFTIDVKDSKGHEAENGTIELNEGDSIVISVDELNFKAGASKIKIYVEGNDEYIYAFNCDYMNHEIKLDPADFPAGEYVIYAVCEEYVHDGLYYASAVSDKVTIQITPENSPFDFLNYLVEIMEALKEFEVPAN